LKNVVFLQFIHLIFICFMTQNLFFRASRTAKVSAAMGQETIQKSWTHPKSLRVGLMLFSLLVLTLFSACKKDDVLTILEKNYFTIEDGEIHKGTIPASTDGESIDDVTHINGNGLAGGTSIVSIVPDEDIKEIYAGVKGIDYYISAVPTQSSGTYTIVILFSQELEENFEFQVSAKFADNSLSRVHTTQIRHIEAGVGALQISLSFDNDKDVDLYVVQPDNEIIYYGNPGYVDADNEDVYLYGLDVDSNAGCDIDGINNENVFYPTDYVQSGKYAVYVNMYENCDPSKATNWVVRATYKGSLVATSSGTNPASGVFPVGTPSNSISDELTGAKKVMEFTITGSRNLRIDSIKKKPAKLSQAAVNKLTATAR
jgi:hypothetical protein